MDIIILTKLLSLCIIPVESRSSRIYLFDPFFSLVFSLTSLSSCCRRDPDHVLIFRQIRRYCCLLTTVPLLTAGGHTVPYTIYSCRMQ